MPDKFAEAAQGAIGTTADSVFGPLSDLLAIAKPVLPDNCMAG